MMYANYRSPYVLLLVVFFCVFFSVAYLPVAHAAAATDPQPFIALSGLPGLDGQGTPNIPHLLNLLYVLAITVGGIIAVVKIAIAGTKYMLSDVVTDKGEARKDIEGALLGLAIILATTVVLKTIYPDLVNLDFLRNYSAVPTDSITVTHSPAPLGTPASNISYGPAQPTSGSGGSGSGNDPSGGRGR
jgi:hypothetical protein